MTDTEYQRYKELGSWLNHGVDLTDAEYDEFKALEKKLYEPVKSDEECPHKGRYIR
jgi:hypothetical protein